MDVQWCQIGPYVKGRFGIAQIRAIAAPFALSDGRPVMANTPESLAFIAIFQPKLREARERLKLSQSEMARRLGCSKDELKKYESRPTSAFPLHLLPRLVIVSDKPMSYWVGATDAELFRRARGNVVPFGDKAGD